MKLKVKVTFFFFQKYAGEVIEVIKRGKNDQLFPPLEALWPSFFWVHTTVARNTPPCPIQGIRFGGQGG